MVIQNLRLHGLSLVVLVASTQAAAAHHPVEIEKPKIDVQILVDGVPLPCRKTGWHRHVSVPEIDTEYVVRITNRGHHRVEAVLSVDGLSAMNGRRASDSIRGYLIRAHDTIEIPGWRRGNGHVARFEFTREEDSYAFRTGRANKIGVIEVAAFAERSRPIPIPAFHYGEEAEAKPSGRFRQLQPQSAHHDADAKSSKSVRREERIGTGYGREQEHRVKQVPFTRGHQKTRVVIQYELARYPVPSAEYFTPAPPGYRAK